MIRRSHTSKDTPARRRSAEGGKVCRACGASFAPRNRLHKFCTRAACFAARRADYLQKYMEGWRQKHPDYWQTEKQRSYLATWRKTHPDYFKKWREKQKRLKKRNRVGK